MRPNASQLRTPLDVSYPRPSRLSDPHHDFSDDFTRAILARPDRELRWNDFKNILGPFLPAGTNEESVYFLPLALEYIASHDDVALDLVTSIVWFVSEFADRLAADGLLVGSRGRIGECFGIWTSRFDVMHFDHASCRAKGWGLNCSVSTLPILRLSPPSRPSYYWYHVDLQVATEGDAGRPPVGEPVPSETHV